MVVSEMGDVLSPNTLPHRHDASDASRYFAFSPLQIFTTMGISTPNVPHAVPILNDSAMPTRKITAGISWEGMGEEATTWPT